MMLALTSRSLALGFLAALVLSLTGCGDGGPTVIPVKGVATYAGKPVANLYLNFLPETGRPSWAMTDAEGRFELQYTREQNGAVLGKHKVFVQFKPANVETEMAMMNGTFKQSPEVAKILQKYGNIETSTKTVEITNNSRQIELNFD